MTRQKAKRIPVIVAAVLIFAAFVGATNASASALRTTTSALWGTAFRACAQSQITATTNLTGNLYLSNIPAACQGLPLKAHPIMFNGSDVGEGSGVATSSTMQFTNFNLLAPLTVKGVLVTVDGWHVPTMWSYAGILYLT